MRAGGKATKSIAFAISAFSATLALFATPVRAEALDVEVRRLSDAVAREVKRAPGDHRDQRFAVVPFVESSAEARDKKLGVVVSDLLLTHLVAEHRLVMVERSRLLDILDEQALAGNGVVDPEDAAEVGQLAGANAVIVGQILDVDGAFTVTARIIDTESAEVRGAATVRIDKAELVTYAADAVVLKSRVDALYRSALVPGWGQHYNGDGDRGVLVGSAIAGFVLVGVIAAVGSVGAHLLYEADQPKPGEAFGADDLARIDAERRTRDLLAATSAVTLGVAAVGWVAQAVDAYLTGTDGASKEPQLR